jgi:hypothetical protein
MDECESEGSAKERMEKSVSVKLALLHQADARLLYSHCMFGTAPSRTALSGADNATPIPCQAPVIYLTMRYVVCGNLASLSCRRFSRRILRPSNLMFAVLLGNCSRNRFDACFWIHPGQAAGCQMAGESLQKRETSSKPSKVQSPPTCQNVTFSSKTLCVCSEDCQ